MGPAGSAVFIGKQSNIKIGKAADSTTIRADSSGFQADSKRIPHRFHLILLVSGRHFSCFLHAASLPSSPLPSCWLKSLGGFGFRSASATCKSLSTACLADCNGVRRTSSAGAASEVSGWQLLVQGSWQSPADLIHAFLQFSLHAELAAAAARAMSFRAAFVTRGSRRFHI